jgi:hypothetical protein
MARKLAFDYTFNKAARQVVLNGNVNPKRLLLINNATANTVIYNVGDPALKATNSVYNAATDKTTVTLNYDTTGMSDTDVLQIFTEQDGVEIKPVDTLLDPVSKFRMSEPNTLIDTDFEYGLQATKWETLERANNIPGYYSISGDTPLTNVADVTTNGTNIVTVICTSPHGLTTGIPIDVRGVDSITAEGTFLVRRTTEFSFTYETRTVQPGSPSVPVSINTAYITITTGRFYVQSQIPFDNSASVDEGPVVTNNDSPSTLTVTTPYKHGFKTGAPFYLTNTLSNRRVNFSAASITSGGNVEDRISYSLDTGNFNPYEPYHTGTTLRVIDGATGISTTADTITLPNHGLVTGDPITYLGTSGTHPTINAVSTGRFAVSAGNLPVYNNGTGAAASAFFYAFVIDADTIRLATNPQNAYNGDVLVDFAASGTGNLTFSLFNSRGYELQQSIATIQTINGQSEVKVTFSSSRTNRNMGVYPERQITLSNTGIAGLDGVYVVKATPTAPGFTSQNWRETDSFFIMEGPSNTTGGALLNQTVSATYTLSNTAAATNTLIRTKNFENTFSPTISSVSGTTLNVSALTNLGDGDLPTRVGSIVRFSNVGSLTGVAINTNYFVSAVTSTTIALSSTHPASAAGVTALTLGGTPGAAVVRVFRSGVRAQVHDGATSWLNHTRCSIHDWCSLTGKMFTRECISSDRIFIKNHGLASGVPIMFIGGGNTWTGGVTPPVESVAQSAIYYVEPINRDEIELRTTETVSGVGPYSGATGATRVNFSTANTWAGGVYQIHPGFTINAFSAATGGSGGGRDRVLGAYANLPAYMTERAEVIIKEGTGSSMVGGVTQTPNTYAQFQKYFARTLINSGPISGASEFSLTLADSGSPINFTSVHTTGAGRFIGIRISENIFSNSFYLPNHGGIAGQRTTYTQTGSFTNGTRDTQAIYPATAGFPGPLFDYVTDSTGVNWPRVSMTLTQPTGAVQGLSNGTVYYMVPINDDVFKVQAFSAATLPTGQPTVQFSITGTASQATNAVSGPFGITDMKFSNTSVANQFGNRIFLPIEQQTLVEGDIIRYESTGSSEVGSAYTGAPGLVNGNLFTVRNVSDFTPLSTGLFTTIDHDSDAAILTLNTSVTSISAGNTLWTGTYLNERLFVNAVGAGTFTIGGQSVTLTVNQIHVTRGFGGTTARAIPSEVTLYRINGSFQLQVRDTATPRSFSVGSGATNATTDTWNLNGHGLRIGETVAISAYATAGTIQNTIINTAQSANAQLYFAIPVDANNFRLAHSRAAAFAGFPIDITNAGSGGSWSFVQYYDSVPLTSSASGTHSLINVSSTGTIDGGYDASSVSDFKMTFSPSTTISNRTITFDPQRNTDLKTGTFFYQNHGLTTGARVVYSRNGNSFEIGRSTGNTNPRAGYNALYDLQVTSISSTGTQVTYNFGTLPSSPFDIVPNQTITISGVTVGGSTANGYNGTFKVVSSTVSSVTVANSTTGGSPAGTAFISGTYYTIRRNLDMFQLAYTKQDALNGIAIQNFSTTGTVNAGHTITTSQVTGESLGNGLATIVARDLIVNGSSTAVVLPASDRIVSSSHGFVTGDRVIYQVWGNGRQINGLVSGRQYFVNRTEGTQSRGGAATSQGANQFSLHNTWVGAYTNTDLVDILGVGTSTLHQFKVTNPTLRGTTFKGEWNTSDNYLYGDVVLFRNSYYMSVTGATAPGQTTVVFNNAQQPVADADGRANLNWMLLSPLPAYSTRFLAQYRGGDSVKLSGRMPIKTLVFSGTGVANTTTGIFNISSHGLSTGDAVVYKLDAQGGYHQGTNGSWSEYTSQLPQQPYGGMTANTIYYINVIDSANFTIHSSPAGAFIGGSTGTGVDQVIPTANGSGASHRFEKYEGFVFDMQVLAVNNDADMIVSDPYPTRQIAFNPQTTAVAVSNLATPVISTERDEIYIPNHGLNTGVKVYYSAGFGIGNVIGGLSEGGTFFVIKINDDVIRLASNLSNALTFQFIDLTSTGQGFNHYLVAATYCSSSYIRYQSGGALVTDAPGVANSNLYLSQTGANIRDGVLQAVPFVYETQMFVRPDCLNLHRSFDGGVEISTSRAPGIEITRQTRRYFRYQSGKGLQYSTGINFSPSIDVSSITHDGSSLATVVCRKPHKLTTSNKIMIEDVEVTSGVATPYTTPANGQFFTVHSVVNEFIFRYATNGVPSDLAPSGFPALFLYEWTNAKVRAGMFDDQNGMFFEYDGQQLYCVRRNSTSQMAGSVAVAFKSNAVVGTGTRFTKQLIPGDWIVIRGMTYKVTAVDSDTNIHISPSYRGTTRSRIVMCKVRDLRVPQSQWNIDKCDGTGVTAFKLDIHRQQMAYMDYSWYGAGKVRFGFKDQKGVVTYVHEFVHNNQENEAYLRSGNLPARYEIENGDAPTYAPSLYHWGASVIMDGKFEDDKAYLFSVASGSSGSDTISIPGTLAGTAVPILSIRLAPSVDTSLIGPLGERDLVNRMILRMNSTGLVVGNTNSRPASVRLILNGNLSQSAYFTNYGAPSLCQIIKHTGQVADTVTGGVTIFEFRAAVNSPITQELKELVELGNSILGGDYVYPNGPDVLTLAIVPTDTAAATTVTARLTWVESQA